jgi:fucose permease
MALSSARPSAAAVLGCAGLVLVGWAGQLVPSLIRSIEPAFAQTDAGIGVYFFVGAVAYVGGSWGGGFLTERIGRKVVLSTAVLLIAFGLAGLATAPTWALFLLATIPNGLGAGAVDGGANGLVLDLYPTSRGRALNLLHLFFSLGALASPLFIGRLLEAGVGWQAIILATGVAAIPIAVALAITHLPSGRHARSPAEDRANGTPRLTPAWPLVALAVAIACYVASEVGVSNWLVRFLEQATIGLATSALALFWAGLALGRLASAAWSDRFDHARFAATAALISSIALAAAAVVPSLPASIFLFGVVGFAFGPVYPLIMAVAGDRFPGRAAAVSGFLAGVAVLGAIVYPPVMGFLSVAAGLGVAMIGAAILAFVCALALFSLEPRRAPAEDPSLA